jgi:methylated-DNA-[protein]-cysteine S-methyltransferase
MNRNVPSKPPARRSSPAASRQLDAVAPSRGGRLLPSPLGALQLVADDQALCGVYFPNHRGAPAPAPATAAQRAILDEAARQLDEYFAGSRRRFSLALRAEGTPFQQQVWLKLREIPFAATWSYGQLATEVGNRNASRAVGAANGQNPLSIVVPCHRVIGADGSLTGFGGGEPAKRWLLDHEAKVAGLRLL